MKKTEKHTYIEKINLAIEQIKPYLQSDGGDLKFIDLTDEMIVQVQLLGACQACPMSIQTLKFGIEHSLMSSIPEIKGVEAV